MLKVSKLAKRIKRKTKIKIRKKKEKKIDISNLKLDTEGKIIIEGTNFNMQEVEDAI